MWLPEEPAQVDALLDDPVFFAQFAPFFPADRPADGAVARRCDPVAGVAAAAKAVSFAVNGGAGG